MELKVIHKSRSALSTTQVLLTSLLRRAHFHVFTEIFFYSDNNDHVMNGRFSTTFYDILKQLAWSMPQNSSPPGFRDTDSPSPLTRQNIGPFERISII